MKLKTFFLVVIVSSAMVCDGQAFQNDSIVVKSVDNDLLPAFRITCENFENSFNDELVKKKTSCDSILIKQIKNQLSKLKYSNSKEK